MLWIFLLAGISPAEPWVKTTRERGGVVVATLTLNHLGHETKDHLQGTGVVERNLSPVLRDDPNLESVSPTVAYLRRIRHDLADRLNPADHTAIREQIDAIQAAYFGKTPPQNLNLPAILAEWSATARKRT